MPWWIRQAITRAIMEQRRTVRLPNHVVERQYKMRVVEQQLEAVHDRPPTVPELSAASGWTPQQVEDLQGSGRSILRLQHPIAQTENREWLPAFADAQAAKPEELIALAQCQQQVEACLSDLTEREAFVLRMRFGIGVDREHTLQEIGDRLGLSRERIRQLERIAVEKLRGSPQNASLEAFLTS